MPFGWDEPHRHSERNAVEWGICPLSYTIQLFSNPAKRGICTWQKDSRLERKQRDGR